jgi:hypothetical protein
VGEKLAQWSVIGQGERLPASSQLYVTLLTRSLHDKLIQYFVVADLVKKYFILYGALGCIAVFTRTCYFLLV